MPGAVSTLTNLVGGALLGAFCAFTVTCTLVEISINPFFAFYFGGLFCLIGALILYRVKNTDHPRPGMLMGFALMVIFAGVLCVLLEQEWFLRAHPMWRVPLYAVLGVSVAFSLTFTLTDLTNHIFYSCRRSEHSRPLVESEEQVMLVIATAVLFGLICGFVFGVEDVEDAARRHDHLAFMRTESICYPIGAVVGGVAAVINARLAEKNEEHRFDPLRDTEFDDEEDY